MKVLNYSIICLDYLRKNQKKKSYKNYTIRKKNKLFFKLSRTNRKESDKLEKEANDILIEIEKIKE